MSRPLSHTPALTHIGAFFGIISIGFGFNALLNPTSALSFYELPYNALSPDKPTVDALLQVYAARDIYMGVVTLAAAYWGSRRMLGVVLGATGLVAFADGAICWFAHGKGVMNHWGYAPVLVGLGATCLGVFDRRATK